MRIKQVIKIVAAVAAAIAASNAQELAPAVPYAREIASLLALFGFLQAKRLQDD